MNAFTRLPIPEPSAEWQARNPDWRTLDPADERWRGNPKDKSGDLKPRRQKAPTKQPDAARIIGDSQPIQGSPGDEYLASRGIQVPAQGWPECIRWTGDAVLFIADGATGAISVPVDGRDRTEAGGGIIRLPGAQDGALILTANPISGLAVWRATGMETHIALGGIGNHEPPIERRVVVARDDDPKETPPDKAITRMLAAWLRAGTNVTVATPWPERRFDRSGFCDALLADGPDAIHRRIGIALDPKPDSPPPPRLPVSKARDRLGEAIGMFFVQAKAWDRPVRAAVKAAESQALADGKKKQERLDAAREARERALTAAGSPPIHVIRCDLGLGKTTAAIDHVIRLLTRLTDEDDERPIVFAVPRIDLGDEIAATFVKAGIHAKVWRGRERPDPDAPGHDMCRDRDAVEDAQAAMLTVQQAVCEGRHEGRPVQCPFFKECGYQRQRNIESVKVWIVAHEMLFISRRDTFGEPAAIVIDEGFWAAGLVGDSGKHIRLSVDALSHEYEVPDDEHATERLWTLRGKLRSAIEQSPDGPITAAALESAGLFSDDAREAHRLEWRRKRTPDIYPGMPAAERREAARAATVNRSIRRYNMAWQAAIDLLSRPGSGASGWLSVGVTDTESGPVRKMTMKGRKSIHAGWHGPTLILDATARMELIAPYYPTAKMTADVRAAAPHQHVCQVLDRTYSKNHMESDGHARDVHAIVCREARIYAPGRVLVVAQADTEAELQRRGNLPCNVVLAHHNAVSGRDGWKDVAGLIVIGRTAPSPSAVERMAEALTGHAAQQVSGWYPQADAWREMTDGTFRLTQSDRHPDPTAEAIRWSVADGELLQIIGRSRGVNRTAETPVSVLVMTCHPLDMPVEKLISSSDLAPSPADEMMAAGGVALSNAADAAKAYPNLWGSHNAARFSFSRWRSRSVSNSYNIYIIRERYTPPNQLSVVRYQRQAKGSKPAQAMVDRSIVPDPGTWLTAKLGPVTILSPELPDSPSQIVKEPAMPDAEIAHEVPGGYGDRPAMLPGMVHGPIGPDEDVLMTGGGVLIMRTTCGYALIADGPLPGSICWTGAYIPHPTVPSDPIPEWVPYPAHYGETACEFWQ